MKMMGIITSQTVKGFGLITFAVIARAHDRSRERIISYIAARAVGKTPHCFDGFWRSPKKLYDAALRHCNRNYLAKLVESLSIGHCEEESDKEISWFQAITVNEIASVRLQWQQEGLFMSPSYLKLHKTWKEESPFQYPVLLPCEPLHVHGSKFPQ